MPPTQRERTLSVNTALGEDALLLRGMTGTERLSVPFAYDLTLVSANIDVRATDLLGTPATVALQLRDGGRRFFNGYLSRFAHTGFDGSYALYRAELVPWLWFLSRTADCRIFQDKTVPDIVKEIFREHGFTDFADRLSGNYRQWPYCVQYRETDLNFVSRLLEHEGIYYFFEHTDGKHTLVLADGYSAHAPAPGYDQVPYYPPDNAALREREQIDNWEVESQVRPGAFAHDAFDFTVPRKDLMARRSAPQGHPLDDLEVFDYQGDYTETADGEGYARIRLEETQAEHEVARAAGNARGLACGGLFRLTGYRREDQNREYLIAAASYWLQSDEFASADAPPGGPVFRCSLSTVDAQIPYRPPRVTPKPVVQGPQTAIVVGKSGEEIWTEKYARVKVLFHWDRYSGGDETSSCWIRVAQVWAGKGWGGIMIPRIGQEVIVDFLEGDPDQPIVTGRVYNGDCMPPYALPANQTQSGIKSRSSKGGGPDNFNEIRFEDKKGGEQIAIHAERNLSTVVEASETRSVGGSRSTTIQKDDTLTVKDGNRTTTLEKGNDTLTLKKGDRTTVLDQGSDTLKVTVGDITIQAPAGTYSLSAKDVKITGTVSVDIVCGASSIKMTPASIVIASPTIEISGSALTTVKGGLVKINC